MLTLQVPGSGGMYPPRERDPDEYQRKYGRLLSAGRLKGAHGGRLT